MIKSYLLFTLLATVLIAYVLFDINTKESDTKNAQLNFTKVTTIIEPSLSASFLEDRFILLTKTINRVYPQMPKADKKGFVYAK